MQGRLNEGYHELALRLRAPMAPVGLAWAAARRDRSGLGLYEGDGHHPSRAGSYLAACVFYTVLTKRNPAHSSFMAGLDHDDARFLQHTASRYAVYGAKL